MHRLVLFVLPLIALLGLTGTADAATAESHAKTYTLTQTFGPFDGAAKWYEPGSVPDGESLFLHCKGDDTAVKGSATINRRTSHGKSATVLRLGRHGVGFDSERGFSEYYAFVDATGKKGWNSVTLTVTCRVN